MALKGGTVPDKTPRIIVAGVIATYVLALVGVLAIISAVITRLNISVC